MGLSRLYFWLQVFILTLFILNCFAEQLMFKITFSRRREEINKPREVKKISRKILKKRQNEVKRNIFLFDEVKNIAGQALTYNSKNFHWPNKKLGLERTMNGLGKRYRKSDPKNWNRKNQSEIAACEQKTTSEKAIFVQTPFSYSTLKLERKISRRNTTRFFAAFPVSAWPKTLLQIDFKKQENVWTDL